MNYHALLIAIQLGLPIIALAYDPKVDRLLHPVAPELILPLADFSLSACQKKATLVWQKKEHYNCQLVEYSKKCKINTQKSLEFIQEQLLKT
jgi:polysaccharide pyruvyl transferase WcaK-like protein